MHSALIRGSLIEFMSALYWWVIAGVEESINFSCIFTHSHRRVGELSLSIYSINLIQIILL